MKRYKKPMPVYLGKTDDSRYEIGTKKRPWGDADDGGFPDFGDSGYVSGFCEEDFERVTGIRLEPGELLKVTITVELQ